MFDVQNPEVPGLMVMMKIADNQPLFKHQCPVLGKILFENPKLGDPYRQNQYVCNCLYLGRIEKVSGRGLNDIYSYSRRNEFDDAYICNDNIIVRYANSDKPKEHNPDFYWPGSHWMTIKELMEYLELPGCRDLKRTYLWIMNYVEIYHRL